MPFRTVTAVLLFALSLLAFPAQAQDIHDELHCLKGCPAGAPATNDLVVRDIYILSNDGTTKFATWVAFRITTETIGTTRRRNWKRDPALDPGDTLERSDYTGANAALKTDRGHQVPLASFTGTDHWRTTNYLSNITPQKSALNQGPWARLEGAARDLARQPGGDAVYGMTGPLYERPMPSLPHANEAHRIPSGYWKVLAIEQAGAVKVQAFLMDQETPRSANYCDHRTTVDAVEQRSGLNFFHELSESKQSGLESGAGTLGVELRCAP